MSDYVNKKLEKYGRWEDVVACGYGEWKTTCSFCGSDILYCPSCGARMVKESG